jgi:hypothetical protein
VRLGKPKNVEDYELHVIEDIDVYLPRGFDPPFPVTIEISSIFGFKSLYLEGWKPV